MTTAGGGTVSSVVGLALADMKKLCLGMQFLKKITGCLVNQKTCFFTCIMIAQSVGISKKRLELKIRLLKCLEGWFSFLWIMLYLIRPSFSDERIMNVAVAW